MNDHDPTNMIPCGMCSGANVAATLADNGNCATCNAKPKNEATTSVRFARQCSTCKNGMEAGYLFGDACYCNECAFGSDADYQAWLANYEEEGEEFYTEWPLEEGEEWFTLQGESSIGELREETCPSCRGSLEFELDGGDGVETEGYVCNDCNKEWAIDIEIKRDWSSITRCIVNDDLEKALKSGEEDYLQSEDRRPMTPALMKSDYAEQLKRLDHEDEIRAYCAGWNALLYNPNYH